jgi:hypothetical protein
MLTLHAVTEVEQPIHTPRSHVLPLGIVTKARTLAADAHKHLCLSLVTVHPQCRRAAGDDT